MDETIVNRVEELSVKYNATMMQISLAWCIAKGVIPIAGVSKFEQAEELVGIFNVNLTEEDIKYLDEPYHAKDLAKEVNLKTFYIVSNLITYIKTNFIHQKNL